MDKEHLGKLSDAAYDACFAAMSPSEHKLMQFIKEGYKAKQIALLGGGSYHSVNTLTRQIRRRLGPSPDGRLIEKAELGRAYRAWETRIEQAPDAGQQIDLHSVDVPKPPDSGSEGDVDHTDAPPEPERPLAEEQQPYAARGQAFNLLDVVPLRIAGRNHNDLNLKITMIAFAILTCLALIAAGSSASLLEAFNSLDGN